MSDDLEQLEQTLRNVRDEARRLFEAYNQQQTQERWTTFMAANKIYQQTARIFWETYRKSYPAELGYLDGQSEP